MKYEVLAHVYVEGLKLPAALELGRVVISANPEGHSPLHAKATYEDENWSEQANRDLFGVAAALGIEWTITAPFRIFHAVQVFADGRRAPLVFFSEPFGGRVTETVLDASGRGTAIAKLVAAADDEAVQLVDWFLWGLQTEHRARDTRLAVIPYSMVLDALSSGKGDMKARWSRLIDRLERQGYAGGPSAKSLVRARNAWVKQQNYRSETGEVEIGHFRELARHGLRVRLQEAIAQT